MRTYSPLDVCGGGVSQGAWYAFSERFAPRSLAEARPRTTASAPSVGLIRNLFLLLSLFWISCASRSTESMSDCQKMSRDMLLANH